MPNNLTAQRSFPAGVLWIFYFLIIANSIDRHSALAPNSLFDRLRLQNPNNVESHTQGEEGVKIVSGTQVKKFDRLTVPLGGNLLTHPIYGNGYGYGYIAPQWQAGARLSGEGESAVAGIVTFHPYGTDVRVTINVTGLPPGKHALHIHTFGDVTGGCKATGGQFPNNFIGNIDTKDDGSISATFLSVFLNLFGFNGIVGRSIVIHEKPIDLNTALNAEVFSSPLQALPNPLAYQNEENAVGPIIACGVISILSTDLEMMLPQK